MELNLQMFPRQREFWQADGSSTLLYESAADTKSSAVQLRDKLLIFDGKAALVARLDDEGAPKICTLAAAAYVPTTMIGRPAGAKVGGTALEAVNMVGSARKNSFCVSSEGQTVLYMDTRPVKTFNKAEVLLQNGIWTEVDWESSNLTEGSLTFETLNVTPVSGMDNYRVEFEAEALGDEDRESRNPPGEADLVEEEGVRVWLFSSGNEIWAKKYWFEIGTSLPRESVDVAIMPADTYYSWSTDYTGKAYPGQYAVTVTESEGAKAVTLGFLSDGYGEDEDPDELEIYTDVELVGGTMGAPAAVAGRAKEVSRAQSEAAETKIEPFDGTSSDNGIIAGADLIAKGSELTTLSSSQGTDVPAEAVPGEHARNAMGNFDNTANVSINNAGGVVNTGAENTAGNARQAQNKALQAVEAVQGEEVYTGQETNGQSGQNLLAGNLQGAENAVPVKVGKATVIQHPYTGAVPQNVAGKTRQVQSEIKPEVLAEAQETINEARQDGHFAGYIRATLQNIFKRSGGQRAVRIENVQFEGEPYEATVNASITKKLAGDHGMTAEKLAVFEQLDKVLAGAEFVGSGAYGKSNAGKQARVIRYDYFENDINVGGKPYVVSFDVEVYKDVNNLRTYKTIEKVSLQPLGADPAPNADAPSEPLAATPGPQPGAANGANSLDNYSIQNGAENVNTSAENADGLDAARKICEKLGVTLRVARLPEGVDGHYANGVITVAPNAESPVNEVFIHELTHHLEQSGGYEQYARFVTQEFERSYGKQALKSYKQQIRELYAEAGEQLSEEGATREMVAECTEDLLADEAMMRRLADFDGGLFSRIANWLSDMAVKLSGTGAQKRAREAARRFEAALREMDSTNTGGKGQYKINPKFAGQLDSWDGKSDRTFELGTTSKALQSIGIDDRRIMLHATKVKKILSKHPGMSMNVIKQVPEILENPIVVLKSQQSASRVAVFGEVQDELGAPVLAVMELQPSGSSGEILDLNIVASAYGKDSNAANFVRKSEVLYIDPNKKRADSWFQGIRLQLPSYKASYGSLGSVTYTDGKVNIEGVPFEDLLNGTGGKGQYKIARTERGERFVDVEQDILQGREEKDVPRVLADVVQNKFNNLIEVNGQSIGINQKTVKEWQFSKDAQSLYNNDKQTYKDKMRSLNNADELLAAAKSYVNEGLKHQRKDKFVGFARGNVDFKVGENGYSADIVVGIRSTGNAYLYDVVNIKQKKIASALYNQPSRSEPDSNALATGTSITPVGANVKGQYKIARTERGERFVDVEQDILQGREEKDVPRVLADVVQNKFNNLIEVNGQGIRINSKTVNEWQWSKEARRLYNADRQTYNDKMRSMDNADELLAAAKSYVNEGLKHQRKDKFAGFARGSVDFKVGENGYTADIVVGIGKDGSATLYDIVNIKQKKIASALFTQPSRSETRGNAPATDTSIIPAGANVKGQYKIARTERGERFVDVEQDILQGREEKDVPRVLADVVQNKFAGKIEVNGQDIYVNQQTRREWQFSKDARRLYENDNEVYKDKIRVFGNADELLEVSRNYINEGLKHPRKDKFVGFARGNVDFKVGDNGYTADIVVGISNGGNAYLYDLVDIERKKITGVHKTDEPQNAEVSRNRTPVDTSIIPAGANVKGENARKANKTRMLENAKKQQEQYDAEVRELRQTELEDEARDAREEARAKVEAEDVQKGIYAGADRSFAVRELTRPNKRTKHDKGWNILTDVSAFVLLI